MADGKRITCYTDEDGCPISSEEVLEFHRFDSEYSGWYNKDNTYFSEYKTVAILSKEELRELEEYLKNIKR